MNDETPTPDAFQQATMSQLTGVLKLILSAAGAALVQRGIIDQNSMTELAAGIATLLVAIGWMIWARRLTGVIKSASAALGDNGVIVAPESIAEKLPKNVVGSVEEAEKVVKAPRRKPANPDTTMTSH